MFNGKSLLSIQNDSTAIWDLPRKYLVDWGNDFSLIATKKEYEKVKEMTISELIKFLLSQLDAFLKGNYKSAYLLFRHPHLLTDDDIKHLGSDAVFGLFRKFGVGDIDRRELNNMTVLWGSQHLFDWKLWNDRMNEDFTTVFKQAVMYDLLSQEDGRLDEDGFYRYLLSTDVEKHQMFLKMGQKGCKRSSMNGEGDTEPNKRFCDQHREWQNACAADEQRWPQSRSAHHREWQPQWAASPQGPASNGPKWQSVGVADEQRWSTNHCAHGGPLQRWCFDHSDNSDLDTWDDNVSFSKPPKHLQLVAAGIHPIGPHKKPRYQVCIHDVKHKCSLRNKRGQYFGACDGFHPDFRIHMDQIRYFCPRGYPIAHTLHLAQHYLSAEPDMYKELERELYRSPLFFDDMPRWY